MTSPATKAIAAASLALSLLSCTQSKDGLHACREIFVSPVGMQDTDGTRLSPLGSLAKAIDMAKPGDTITMTEGVFKPSEDEIMGIKRGGLYACVFILKKDGTADRRITLRGQGAGKTTIDLSNIAPEGKRVTGFMMAGDYWSLENFDIRGIRVSIKHHTQSENISIDGASNCTLRNLCMHDGMGIGVYLRRGSNNLILNCDAYNNYDPVSENGYGGNCDGFGIHPKMPTDTGNVVKGCRAWQNSDDGFDLINSYAPVTIDSCWAWRNGYDADMNERADGTGVKAGGYALQKLPEPIDAPHNTISNCIAWQNKGNGIYANHHLGGNTWRNNRSMGNLNNYDMVNQKAFDENVDVPGYGHVLIGNISVLPREKDIARLDETRSECTGNNFGPDATGSNPRDTAAYVSTDGRQLAHPRKADGSLPDTDFLKLKD